MNGGTLVYDGDCAFCQRSITALRRWSGSTARAVPWQDTDLAAAGLDEDHCRRAVQWLGPEGHSEGAASLRAFVAAGRPSARLIAHLVVNPMTRPAADMVYRVVARHRHRLGSSSCAIGAGACLSSPRSTSTEPPHADRHHSPTP